MRSLKNLTFRGGSSRKTNIEGGGELEQFADLRGAWQERGDGLFEGGGGGFGWLIPRCTLWNEWAMRTMQLPFYLFKFNNGNTRTMCKISLKLRIKTPERHWRRSGVLILTLNRFHTLFCFHCWLWTSKSRLHRSHYSFSFDLNCFKSRVKRYFAPSVS